MSKILLIDDNPVNLKLATEVLQGAGCTALTAGDAEEAQAILRDTCPDLILMDIALPGMDGLTLTRKLKANPRYAAIPIVALTASAMKGDETRALAAGCEGYISKPIDTRTFARQVLAHIATPAPDPATVFPSPPRPTVLVVDDLEIHRRLLRAGLESNGYLVVEASNGVEALDMLSKHPVDAVISDILMPRMDGYRLCREIRSGTEDYAHVPFILYTSTYDSAGDRQLARNVGADAYLLKPSPMPDLLAALNAAGARPKPLHVAVPGPPIGEVEVLEQYNSALVRKLESRNTQLQEANRNLQAAHRQILELNETLERRVRDRTEALTSANEELEAFSYTVAHDLRAPLRHISGFAQLVLETDGGRLSGEGASYLATVISAAKHLDRLIQDLLSFSNLGRQPLRIMDIDLELIVQEALDRLAPDIAGKFIQWQRSRLPSVAGDAGLLRQVFVNLISNAIKFTRDRHPATIEIGCDASTETEIVVAVRDNGIGFDMRHANSLFRAFYRLHTNKEIDGTGIGLAIVDRIVRRHGGRVWAEGLPNRGAAFHFSLPKRSL